MFLTNIQIHNYKAIADMEITLKPGVNLLIGNNGVGKTSILEAVTVGLGGYFRGIKGVSSRGITQSDVRFTMKPTGDASTTKICSTPVEIKCEGSWGDEIYHWSVSRKDELGSSRTIVSNSPLVKRTRTEINDSSSILPVIAYQSTTRIASFRRGDYAASIKKMNDRRAGYMGCVGNALDAKAITAWCLKMDMAEYKQKREIREYEAFKKTVIRFMMEMEETNDEPILAYDTSVDELTYGTQDGVYPISYLSAGYQSILWMVMDLAYRNALLNPHVQDPEDMHGIVLIDEIDMHLHPKWQWKVVPALQNTFPNMQFIIATHSPIIISSCKCANLALLEEDHTITYEDCAYAYSIRDVVEVIQGSDAIPRALRKLSNDFDEALNDENYEKAGGILNEMKEQFGDDNTEVKAAKFELGVETSEM